MSRLVDGFRGIICDVDGVVVAGPASVPHAVTVLNSLSVPVVFATNNASRTPQDVSRMLRDQGVESSPERVLTSSLAAARELADGLPVQSRVLAIGGPGVAAALTSAGLHAVLPGEEGDVVAVVQGYGPDVRAGDLAAATLAIRGGARWVATNEDLTLPTDQGPVPGNGSLVAAVQASVGVRPEVIGKPHPPMYTLAAQAMGVAPRHTLAVGDRLETDIAGARVTGIAAALVLTGVHGAADAAAASPEMRPTHVLTDLRELLEPYPEADQDGEWFVRGRARATWQDGLVLEGEGIDATRAGLDAVWHAVDTGTIGSGAARDALTSG